MCTPWTITKLVKKDCASCFLACRFPLDDEAVDDRRRYATTTPQLPMRNMMAFDYQRDFGENERVRNKNMSPSRHKNSNLSARRRLRHDPKQVKEIASTSRISSTTSRPVRYQSSDEESSCRHLPHFADEDQDYIVFCFKEDGAFEVEKNVKPEGQNCRDSTSSKNSRQINRKLNYDQNTKTVGKCSNEERLTEKACEINIYPTNDGNFIIFDQKNEGRDGKNTCSDTKATTAAGSMGEVSIESSDSNQSDHSTGSFAFPVLAVEWPGSPVQLPKPEELDLREHKARCIGLQFQCCRF
ncbi:protein BREAKING OF ASYMMETRY IN THE STOMATAL LINEAGE isoform X2 [Rosa rugosa]|uniref:protein BREAKING OF ASYMMETRY IN THE STOMATAL LINEAGE isoform X2 n=1 Tax=Rosa rugosa TaxID=74645 RepID=UPI002B40FF09|nr:protein BREAKING OF ASYMMETRY IN THE STOMATAL LINEAGE isoform X2 [Rosa rugosa]